MKTRTLLLLSVGVGLAILLAGGVFLFQLSNEAATVDVAKLGERVEVGDVEVTVHGVIATDSTSSFSVEIELGGVDDADGTDSFRLITGADPLSPVSAPNPGRCTEITQEPQECRLDFDTSTTEGPNRVLVLRRGDEQRRWDLSSS